MSVLLTLKIKAASYFTSKKKNGFILEFKKKLQSRTNKLQKNQATKERYALLGRVL